ncbi:MAG: TonB-dependent receptor [Bacteroidota bacterium]
MSLRCWIIGIGLGYFSLFSWPLFGQELMTLTGHVFDQNGQSIPGATVRIGDLGVVTDLNGKFTVSGVPQGTLPVVISVVGYETQEIEVKMEGRSYPPLRVTLQESTTVLENVVIRGKSEASLLREQAYAVEVIDAKQFNNLSTDVNEMLGRIAGVNVRQSGGLGSGFTLSLNGLSGNRIRTFINGVPMDYFGSSLTLNNFPPNLLSAVEVYKGAVPIHLSSDALGGAINITTTDVPLNYLDAAYSLGSFNTHRASLNGQWIDKKTHFTARLKSFVNHSDNDYTMQVNLLNRETGQLDETPTEVRRFHDAYTSRMAWLEAGFTEVKWADEFMVGAMYSDNTNELQQNPFVTGLSLFPLGQVSTAEQKGIYTATYRKQDVGLKGLNLRGYAVWVNSEEQYTDTSAARYDWFGGFEPDVHPTTGELGRKSLFQLSRTNLLTNVHGEYAINTWQGVAINVSTNALTLVGSDAFQPRNNTQYSTPNRVSKGTLGASYTLKLLQDTWHNTLFSKGYRYSLVANNPDYQGNEINSFSDLQHRLGFGLASTWKPNDRIQVKGSFERAYRFPESFELYGDGLAVIPNPALLPEQSENYNLGFRWTQPDQWQVEVNGFVRNTRDYIRFRPQLTRSQYINDPMVLATGLDASVMARLPWGIQLQGSATYLDLRNSDPEATVYRDRLPNEPYAFANLAATYALPLPWDRQQATLSFVQQYVHEFFLDWPSISSVDTKSVIPTQYVANMELTYSFQDGQYNLSGQVSNLFDAEVFDNFNQPRPGRAYSLKVRVYLHNRSSF